MECQTALATEDQSFIVSKTDPISETEIRVYFTDKPAQHNKPEGEKKKKNRKKKKGGEEDFLRTSFFLFKDWGIFS